MRKNENKISNFRSYEELGEFWDVHSLADFWDMTEEVHFNPELKGHTKLVAPDDKISKRLVILLENRESLQKP